MIHHADLAKITPPLPDLGADIVELSITTESADVKVRMMQPHHPTRAIIEFGDDDTYEVVGYRSDEEMAELQAAYEKASIEWRRTNGLAIAKGPIVEMARLTLVTGETVELVGDGKVWEITRRGTFSMVDRAGNRTGTRI